MNQPKRWGGPHSPGGPRDAAPVAPRRASRWSGRAVTSISLRAIGLYVVATPVLFGALFQLLLGRATYGVGLLLAYALLIAGAAMTKEGIKAAQAYEASALARPPALPRKALGALLTGGGVFLCGWRGGPVLQPAVLGAVAAGLHLFAFGPDPMRAKGLAGLEGQALDEAVTRIDTARRLIGEMTAAAERFGDRLLADRVTRLAQSATAVLAQLEKDPGDIRRARRFLAVYVVGARDATVKFAQAWAESRDPEVAQRYSALLEDLEGHFRRHREELAQSDRAALDVEIEVLRERLKMEGV